MIWLYVYPLVDNLPSLVRHNAMEQQARLDWAGEYDMIPMHFLCRLFLDLNAWCILVEEEVGGIDIPSIYAL